jgi:hypothetical protein
MSITIRHLDGPLAGLQQHFDDSYDTVAFGRDPEACQVVYPPDYNVVGKKHFQLKRNRAGEYAVDLLGNRYVEIDGTPADVGAAVASGNVLRLGRYDGPSFKVEITKPTVKGVVWTGPPVVLALFCRDRQIVDAGNSSVPRTSTLNSQFPLP